MPRSLQRGREAAMVSTHSAKGSPCSSNRPRMVEVKVAMMLALTPLPMPSESTKTGCWPLSKAA